MLPILQGDRRRLGASCALMGPIVLPDFAPTNGPEPSCRGVLVRLQACTGGQDGGVIGHLAYWLLGPRKPVGVFAAEQ